MRMIPARLSPHLRCSQIHAPSHRQDSSLAPIRTSTICHSLRPLPNACLSLTLKVPNCGGRPLNFSLFIPSPPKATRPRQYLQDPDRSISVWTGPQPARERVRVMCWYPREYPCHCLAATTVTTLLLPCPRLPTNFVHGHLALQLFIFDDAVDSFQRSKSVRAPVVGSRETCVLLPSTFLFSLYLILVPNPAQARAFYCYVRRRPPIRLLHLAERLMRSIIH
jgi:hypothetical protein